MIKLEHTVLPSPEQMQFVIEGMRNPLNSWDKSDSDITRVCTEGGKLILANSVNNFSLGDADHNLMQRLAKAGTDHRKYMRMMPVYVRITAPLYWWSEFDTYKVGTVANSCSKMHKLLEKPFEVSDFSFDRLPGYKNEIKQFRPKIDEDMVASEIWVIYDNDYDISNYGRVKHKLKNKYRIISGTIHSDGYIYVNLHGKQYPLHRLVGKLFHANTFSEGLVINHKDGNKQNNFETNLEWVTQSDNVKHSYENHLQPNQVNTYKGKFTQEQRNTIKEQWDSGNYSRKELAIMWNVSWTCIDDIIRDRYKYANNINVFEELCKPLVDTLNELRDSWFNAENEVDKKTIWYTILQLLPESYNQTRNVMLNYEVLANMYHSRKNHKLDEWREFCKWIENLPYAELIIGEEVSSADNSYVQR